MIPLSHRFFASYHAGNSKGVSVQAEIQKFRKQKFCVLGNKLLNIQFAKYHIWNNKSEGFPNMVLSTETFNQSVRTEYSEAVNVRHTFQPLWVSGPS